MSKYIINEQVMGCETVGITDEKLLQDVNNQIYLVLNEKDINTVLDGIEDKNLRAKIKQILYARVFKTRY